MVLSRSLFINICFDFYDLQLHTLGLFASCITLSNIVYHHTDAVGDPFCDSLQPPLLEWKEGRWCHRLKPLLLVVWLVSNHVTSIFYCQLFPKLLHSILFVNITNKNRKRGCKTGVCMCDLIFQYHFSGQSTTGGGKCRSKRPDLAWPNEPANVGRWVVVGLRYIKYENEVTCFQAVLKFDLHGFLLMRWQWARVMQ